MPRLSSPDGSYPVMRHYFKWAKILDINSALDAAKIIIVDKDLKETEEIWDNVPIFYHCSPDVIQKNNLALDEASSAFSVGDIVIVRFEDNSPVIVGRREGLKDCKKEFLLVYGTSVQVFCVQDAEEFQTGECYAYVDNNVKKTGEIYHINYCPPAGGNCNLLALFGRFDFGLDYSFGKVQDNLIYQKHGEDIKKAKIVNYIPVHWKTLWLAYRFKENGEIEDWIPHYRSYFTTPYAPPENFYFSCTDDNNTDGCGDLGSFICGGWKSRTYEDFTLSAFIYPAGELLFWAIKVSHKGSPIPFLEGETFRYVFLGNNWNRTICRNIDCTKIISVYMGFEIWEQDGEIYIGAVADQEWVYYIFKFDKRINAFVLLHKIPSLVAEHLQNEGHSWDTINLAYRLLGFGYSKEEGLIAYWGFIGSKEGYWHGGAKRYYKEQVLNNSFEILEVPDDYAPNGGIILDTLFNEITKELYIYFQPHPKVTHDTPAMELRSPQGYTFHLWWTNPLGAYCVSGFDAHDPSFIDLFYYAYCSSQKEWSQQQGWICCKMWWEYGECKRECCEYNNFCQDEPAGSPGPIIQQPVTQEPFASFGWQCPIMESFQLWYNDGDRRIGHKTEMRSQYPGAYVKEGWEYTDYGIEILGDEIIDKGDSGLHGEWYWCTPVGTSAYVYENWYYETNPHWEYSCYVRCNPAGTTCMFNNFFTKDLERWMFEIEDYSCEYIEKRGKGTATLGDCGTEDHHMIRGDAELLDCDDGFPHDGWEAILYRYTDEKKGINLKNIVVYRNQDTGELIIKGLSNLTKLDNWEHVFFTVK